MNVAGVVRQARGDYLFGEELVTILWSQSTQ